jgi:hypothetical protein
VEDRRDGIPTGPTGTKPLARRCQFRFPLGFQGLAYDGLSRPFLQGGHPERPLGRRAAFGSPQTSERGGCVIKRALVGSPSSLRWLQRFHPIKARRVSSPIVVGAPTYRSEPSVPGLAQQVLALTYCPDISALRGLVNALLEAEDMPMNLAPGALVPGRRQALSILRFGSLPLTHHFPFQHTAPTSAYPGHYSRRLLLRGSSSPVASGWHLLSAVTASERATGGYSVPSSHCSHP